MTRFIEITILLFVLAAGYLTLVVLNTPDVQKIKGCIRTKMYKVNLCDRNPGYTRLGNFSPHLKNLILIAEDAGFYYHSGFDWEELKKSFLLDLKHGKIARGGSTITQQLAKNVFLTFDRTLVRKLREAILATQIEHVLSKDEILEKYLNVVEMGPNLFGFGAASKFYFSKPASELNVLEAAFLVYLVPNPKHYSKVYRLGELTSYARYRVLDLCYRLYRFHKIEYSQYQAAKEYVDSFPWKSLTSDQVARLKGGEPTWGELPQDNSLDTLPDVDVEVPYVEPPSDDDEELEEQPFE